jgi:rod shape-determining protein MreD
VLDRVLVVAENAYFRLFMVGLVFLGLQTTILNELRPFDVCLQSMLLLSVAAGLAKGSEIGAIVGFMMGLMYDMELTTPLGVTAVVFAAAGYLAGIADVFVHESTWWSRTLIGTAASMAGMVMMPVALSMVGVEGALTSRVYVIVIVVGVFNAVLSEVAVKICRWAFGTVIPAGAPV